MIPSILSYHEFRMPADWALHERCLMAWPVRQDMWREHFDQAKADYAATAKAIASFEPVLMVAPPSAAQEAKRYLGSDIEVAELPLDDSWLRDSGPIILANALGDRLGLDFTFNSWGEKFIPYADDACLAERLLTHLAIPRRVVPMVLEGGSIAVDGEGTLITTEQCLLHPNRNPTLTRGQIEDHLRQSFGVTTIIWLPYGLAEDDDTDGHVDNVCSFLRPGEVLLQTITDHSNPNYARMEANRRVLEAAHDAAGRSFTISTMPILPYIVGSSLPTALSYINFYLANGGVVVPVANAPTDAEALERIASAFPNHSVVPVPGRVLALGGGGVHCITQQLPLGR